MQRNIILSLLLFFILLSRCSESSETSQSPQEHFKANCASCHLAPNPAHITKDIWKNNVLPEMAARLGYKHNGYNPMANSSMEESFFIKLSRVYPTEPNIDSITWNQIQDYILENAPDEIPVDSLRNQRNVNISQFTPTPISNGQKDQAVVTNIQFDTIENHFIIGDGYGKMRHWSLSKNNVIQSFYSPLISYQKRGQVEYLTEIGYMNPSENPLGTTYRKQNGQQKILAKELHRPVYTQVADLNNDKIDEVLICEFGNLTGQLSMLTQSDNEVKKRILLPLAGTIKTEVVDINNDGKKDIIVLASQGKEGIYILYQEGDLKFRLEQVVEMGSEYGSSWFELVDYDGDQDLDIILVNGDNADYSIFSKPYHGIRIFLNNGKNKFEEKWFYPIYGATRLIANDFDQDGDIDFAVASFFPDFDFVPEENFVFFENKNAEQFEFKTSTFAQPLAGRILVMEEGDVDQDGDVDILLGSFVAFPGEVNGNIAKEWMEEKADLFFLENKLY